MEKLSMCRICLIKDVRLHCLVNTHLQEIFELLSGNLLETKDTRPLHACYICCARLRNCLRLRTACLHSEELFSHLLEKGSCQVTPSQDKDMLQRVPVLHRNVDPVIHTELDTHHSPATDEQVIRDWIEDSEDNTVDQENCSQFIKEDIKSEVVKISSEHKDLDGTQESSISKSNQSISSVDLQDICDKPVKIEVQHQMDLSSFPKHLQDNITDKGICSQIIKSEDLKSGNVGFEDNELNYCMKSIKVENNSDSDNSCVGDGTQESYILKSNENISFVDLQDICDKPVKIEVQQMDLSSFPNPATVTKHLNPTDLENTSQFNNSNNRQNVEMLNICEEYKQIAHTSSETHCSENSDSFKCIRLHTREKSFWCPTCGKCFSRNSNLTVHIRTHATGTRYKCDTCGKGFPRMSSLSRHILLHTVEKPYKCDTCRKGFKTKRCLTRHIRIHTDEKPYKCDTCGKYFRALSALSIHILTHTGEKPYKCDTCGKGYIRNVDLLSHILTHTGEKPYECDTCGKGFIRKFDLSCHIFTHTPEKPYKCGTCGKGFVRKLHLSSHILTHTGETPYECDTCGKGFIRKFDLSCHIFTHTPEKPFKCGTCGKGFIRKLHLSSHILTHT